MDCFDLLAVQGTLKSLLQYYNSRASILQCSAFFIVQLSHPYMNTGKTIALTRWTFVENIMFLLFNMLSRLVVTFLPRSKHLLVSWMQSPSAVILELKKNKVWHCLHCFPIYLPWSDGTRRRDLSFLFFFFFYFIFKLYNILLVLPNIEMNPPQVYLCSASWTLLPPPSPYHPSGSSQCTSPKHPVSCIKPGLETRSIYVSFLNVEFWANFFTLLFHFHQEAL